MRGAKTPAKKKDRISTLVIDFNYQMTTSSWPLSLKVTLTPMA